MEYFEKYLLKVVFW